MPVRKSPVVLPANSPVLPMQAQQEIVWALKGLQGGDADAGQQTMALNWILHELTRVLDLSYRPGGRARARDSDVAEGKRYCGLEIIRLLKMTPEQIAKLPRFGAATQEDDGAIRDR